MRKPSATNLGQELGHPANLVACWVGRSGSPTATLACRARISPYAAVEASIHRRGESILLPRPHNQPSPERFKLPLGCAVALDCPKRLGTRVAEMAPMLCQLVYSRLAFQQEADRNAEPGTLGCGRTCAIVAASICSTNLVLCMLIVGVKSWYPRDAAARPTIQKRRYIVILNSWCILVIVIY